MELTLTESIEKQNKLLALGNNYISKNKGNTIDLIELNEFVNCYMVLNSKEEYRKLNSISLRTGAIAIIEEMILETGKSDRELFNYKIIITKTRVRFKKELSNTDRREFNTVEKIHPEKPCEAYETLTNNVKLNKHNAARKRHYREALQKIIIGQNWILENKDAVISLQTILENVKKC